MQRKIRTITRINALIFIVIAFALAMAMPAMATEVVINDASAYYGDSTFTSIMLVDAVNAGEIDLNLSYDPATVIVTDVTDSDFDTVIPNLVKNGAGFVRILAFQINNPGLNGSVLVANLTLEAVGDSGSTSPLSISVNELKDVTPDSNDITHTITSGTFTVTPAEEPTPTPGPGGGGGGGYVSTTPTPTATPAVPETPTATLAPTSTPLTTPAQTPASTIPPTTSERKQIVIIGLIALAAIAVIIIFVKYHRHRGGGKD